MNIGICILSVGKYNDHLIPLIESINKNFLLSYNKHIFLFSDISEELHFSNTKIYENISYLPFPLITLLRYNWFVKYIEYYKKMDFMYYIDVDCLVVDEISDEILPNKIGQMVATVHPWNKTARIDSFERDTKSVACVGDVIPDYYYQGSFFGGYTVDFIKLIIELDKNIKMDLKNLIIAKWYDESHLNKYFLQNPPKSLHSGYAYPPDQMFTYDQKIIHYNSHFTKTDII